MTNEQEALVIQIVKDALEGEIDMVAKLSSILANECFKTGNPYMANELLEAVNKRPYLLIKKQERDVGNNGQRFI